METPQNDLETTVRYLKALAQPTRLRLLGILADGEFSVWELADLLELKEPTISHHLSILHELDLVQMRPHGTAHLYTLKPETLHQLSRDLLRPERVTAVSQEPSGDSWEQKVLATFLNGEILTQIPTQRKKRNVILRWLSDKFVVGQRYGELEVNALLKRHHADVATLRRELVAENLLRRADGIYWREA